METSMKYIGMLYTTLPTTQYHFNTHTHLCIQAHTHLQTNTHSIAYSLDTVNIYRRTLIIDARSLHLSSIDVDNEIMRYVDV